MADRKAVTGFSIFPDTPVNLQVEYNQTHQQTLHTYNLQIATAQPDEPTLFLVSRAQLELLADLIREKLS